MNEIKAWKRYDVLYQEDMRKPVGDHVGNLSGVQVVEFIRSKPDMQELRRYSFVEVNK